MFESQLVAQAVSQTLGRIFFTMNDECLSRPLLHDPGKLDEPFPVGMAGKTGQRNQLGSDLEFIAENANGLCFFGEFSSKRVGRLPAGHKNRVARIADTVAQMVQDPRAYRLS